MGNENIKNIFRLLGQQKAYVLTGAGRESEEKPKGKINQRAVIRRVVSELSFASFGAFSLAFQPAKRP